MSSIAIHDLANSTELDQHAMSSVRGGNSWLAGLGPIANVNVGITQNLNQLQNVDVNTLNNVGVIGGQCGDHPEPEPVTKCGRQHLEQCRRHRCRLHSTQYRRQPVPMGQYQRRTLMFAA
ncbi:hypothetical protein [Noviherbaspirillum sp. Root189]|uniref:hypothetical protein n=1 Tax=Noviherbaspirillum sp. Root189 TaxID=1736487 RepID=UPI001F1B4088|nr:hypothetical protein [Noviherbaspirillum sp. Root189]